MLAAAVLAQTYLAQLPAMVEQVVAVTVAQRQVQTEPLILVVVGVVHKQLLVALVVQA